MRVHLKKQFTILLLIICAVCAVCAVLFCACGNSPQSDDAATEPPIENISAEKGKNQVDLAFLAEDNAIEGKSLFRLEKNKGATVHVRLGEGYCLTGVEYSGKYKYVGSMGVVIFHFDNVKYDGTVRLKTDRSFSQIDYYLNGGSFIDFDTDMDKYSQTGRSQSHLRKNTELGTDTVYRSGYILTGWNTEADGSGEHIGAGSRVTVKDGEKLALYADWAKWTDKSMFLYEKNMFTASDSDDICIVRYLGDSCDSLVIPEEIDGHKVTRLNENFAQNKSFKKFVMGSNVRYVGDNRNCSIEEIFLTDAECVFSFGGFNDDIKKIHISAVVPPTMNGVNGNAMFAEAIDRLIVNYHTNKKNMVLFAGCSLGYGLNSERMDRAFDGEYTVTNVGINGDVNMLFQLQCIEKYLKEDDVFIHAPETGSEFSMLSDLGYRKDSEWMLFSCIESNYDLLTLAEPGTLKNIFSALEAFNEKRKEYEPTGYEGWNIYYNEYCDYTELRDKNFFEPGKTFFDSEVMYFNSDFLTVDASDRLNENYKILKDKGVNVFYSYSPVNRDVLNANGESKKRSWVKFNEKLHVVLNANNVVIISDPMDYIFDHDYFYDTDYHLTTQGAIIRTENLIKDLKAVIE